MGWLELYRETMGQAADVRIKEEEARAILEKPMKTLTPTKRAILELRHGLKDGRNLIFKAIGEAVGLARPTVQGHYRGACSQLWRTVSQAQKDEDALSKASGRLNKAWPLLARDLWTLTLDELILVRSVKDEILQRLEELKTQLEA